MSPDLAARLETVHIQVLAETAGYTLVGRENLVAFVAHSGSIGSTGMMTENGLAYLVWREGRAMLASKGVEVPADEADLEAIRGFADDLKRVFG